MIEERVQEMLRKIKMNHEIQKIVNRMKTVQGKFEEALNNADLMTEARKYAEKQGKEIKKLFSGDVQKLRHFLERERKELEKFRKQIPGELKKVNRFIGTQKKEFEKILKTVSKTSAKKSAGGSKARTTAKKATSKKSSSKKAR